MFDGEGSYLFGGRWNSSGQRVVYLGSSLALAALEMLVNLPRPQDVLKNFNVVPVHFDERFMEYIDIEDLPSDWAKKTMKPQTQTIGDNWIAEASSLILKVPSAVIIGELNYLLNPNHPDFKHLEFGEIATHVFDPRLLKVNNTTSS